ncbi:hypothetical protein [Telluribacter humicola]|uniref:hypothetical protein n=1 Tax=Telluribacter humicola TaxID=1720261 RepID=UPI001A95F97F|nr:hypothetical protein [Telluribacter humicola]
MKKLTGYLLLVYLGLTLPHCALAQTDSIRISKPTIPDRRAKAIYMEAFGSSGFYYSLNCDMRFRKGLKGWGVRVGITKPVTVGVATTYSGPILINYVTSERSVALEAGLGIVVANTRYTHEDQYNVIRKYSHYDYNYGVANVGIRVQPKRTGIMWRLYWAPNWVMGPDYNNQKTLMWFGTSLGVGFK